MDIPQIPFRDIAAISANAVIIYQHKEHYLPQIPPDKTQFVVGVSFWGSR